MLLLIKVSFRPSCSTNISDKANFPPLEQRRVRKAAGPEGKEVTASTLLADVVLDLGSHTLSKATRGF